MLFKVTFLLSHDMILACGSFMHLNRISSFRPFVPNVYCFPLSSWISTCYRSSGRNLGSTCRMTRWQCSACARLPRRYGKWSYIGGTVQPERYRTGAVVSLGLVPLFKISYPFSFSQHLVMNTVFIVPPTFQICFSIWVDVAFFYCHFAAFVDGLVTIVCDIMSTPSELEVAIPENEPVYSKSPSILRKILGTV